MVCFASLPLSLSRKDSERLHGPVVCCFSAFQPLFALRRDSGRLHGPVVCGLPVCCGDRVLLMEEKKRSIRRKKRPKCSRWKRIGSIGSTRKHSEALGGARRTSEDLGGPRESVGTIALILSHFVFGVLLIPGVPGRTGHVLSRSKKGLDVLGGTFYVLPDALGGWCRG